MLAVPILSLRDRSHSAASAAAYYISFNAYVNARCIMETYHEAKSVIYYDWFELLVYLHCPDSDISSRRHLRSASRQLCVTPHYHLTMCCRLAFSVVSPTLCGSLCWTVCAIQPFSFDRFKRQLMMFLLSKYLRIRVLRRCALQIDLLT